MHDPNHKEGDKYLYFCESCGHIRGELDKPDYSTKCPNCKIPYEVEKIGGIRINPPLRFNINQPLVFQTIELPTKKIDNVAAEFKDVEEEP